MLRGTPAGKNDEMSLTSCVLQLFNPPPCWPVGGAPINRETSLNFWCPFLSCRPMIAWTFRFTSKLSIFFIDIDVNTPEIRHIYHISTPEPWLKGHPQRKKKKSPNFWRIFSSCRPMIAWTSPFIQAIVCRIRPITLRTLELPSFMQRALLQLFPRSDKNLVSKFQPPTPTI